MERSWDAKLAGILLAVALAASVFLSLALGGGPGGSSVETPGGGGGYEVFVP